MIKNNYNLKLGSLVFLVGVLLAGCGDDKETTKVETKISIKESEESLHKEYNRDEISLAEYAGYNSIQSPWIEKKGKAQDGNEKVYQNISTSMIDINNVFTEMIITVLEKPGKSKNDYKVSLRVESGRFFCMNPGACEVVVNIGDSIKKYEYYDVKGGSDTVFLKNSKAFMGMIKKEKSLSIEANFYENGSRKFDFEVSNFPKIPEDAKVLAQEKPNEPS